MAKVLNCATTPVDKAYKYTQEQCDAEGKMLSDYFSDFYENYLKLQEKCDLALDLPRIEMPVIEPEHMDEFEESLDKGHIDVNEPIAKSPEMRKNTSKYPTDLGFDLRGRAWLFKGLRDGAKSDDIIQADMTEIAVAELKPTQSQIWLEKVVGMSLYFGPLKQSSKFLHEAPIIVSSDGYILDGHHRFGAAMVSNPSLRLTALKVDMPIDELVKMARSYGNAIGNEQKAAETFGADDLGDEIAKQYVKKGKSKEEAQKIGDATAYKVGVAKYGKKVMAKKAKAGKKAPAKKAPAKKAPAKKAPAKKAPAKKTPAKKTPAKKTPAKENPTVLALELWVRNTEPYKSTPSYRRRAIEQYIPKGDYKITKNLCPRLL